MGSPLGFVGLGNMGSRIARVMLEKGHRLIVFDSRDEAIQSLAVHGACPAASAREVGSLAQIVFVCLPTPEVVQTVILGEDGIAEGESVRIVVDLSTTGLVAAQAVEKRLQSLGIAAIDSPVSGGLAAAERGTLALMVAGAKAPVDEVLPILKSFGTPTHISEVVGLGQMMKLINNLLSGTAIAITAEAMVLGVKAGLDAETMLAVLNLGSGRNCATEERFPNHVLDRSFENGFANGLMRKDIRLCLEMGERLEVPLWVGTAVGRMWTQAVVQVGPEKGTTSIVKVIEQWAGVEVRGRAYRPAAESSTSSV